MEKQTNSVEPEVGSENDHNNEVSQLDLIKQWRLALESLKNDVGVGAISGDVSEEDFSDVLEGIDYLDRTNKLLDENDDFLLSDSGFLKYKRQHMLVFDYLSQSVKPKDSDINSKFYFVSRSKHIAQQHKISNGKHSFVHFLFIVVVILALGIASLWMVIQTQQNLVVKVLLLWFFFIHLRSAVQLIKPFKKTAATPFRFRVSLLGIHALNTFIKVNLMCFIPIGIALASKHYWVDDVIIISLATLCLFHFRPDGKQQTQTIENDNMKEEATNV